MTKIISLQQMPTADLIVDAIYESSNDGHPIIFISGRDIAEILIQNGYNSKALVKRLLETEFPLPGI